MTKLERIVRVLFNRTFHRREIEIALKRAHFEDNHLEMTMQHPQFAVIARELCAYFREVGGKNYMTLTLYDPATLEAFELTMQRVNGRTVSEVNGRMQKLITDIDRQPERARELIAEMNAEIDWHGEDAVDAT